MGVCSAVETRNCEYWFNACSFATNCRWKGTCSTAFMKTVWHEMYVIKYWKQKPGFCLLISSIILNILRYWAIYTLQEKKLEEEDEALIKSIVFNVRPFFLYVFPLPLKPFTVVSFCFLGIKNFHMLLSILLCRTQTVMLEEFQMMNLMMVVLFNIWPTMI